MKKENYGLPTALLCIAAYMFALSASTSMYGLVSLVGLTIAVFALHFDSKVRKTLVQALGLALIFVGCSVFFDTILGSVFGLDIASGYTWSLITGSLSGGTLIFTIIYKIIGIVECFICIALIVAILAKVDIILTVVHKAVDGFVPMNPYTAQGYGSPQFAGAPQQPYGAPQQFAGPQQPYGAPQPMPNQAPTMNGGPQQFVNGNPQMMNRPMGQSMGQPMNGPIPPQTGQGQPMNNVPGQFNNQPR